MGLTPSPLQPFRWPRPVLLSACLEEQAPLCSAEALLETGVLGEGSFLVRFLDS